MLVLWKSIYLLSKSHHFFDILRYYRGSFLKKSCCNTKQSIHPWHLISILWDGLLSIFPTATTTFSSFSLATSALTAAALTRPLMEDGSHVAFPSTAGSISCCAETAVVVRRPRQPQHRTTYTQGSVCCGCSGPITSLHVLLLRVSIESVAYVKFLL